MHATKERSNATEIVHPALSVSSIVLIVHTLWPQRRKRLHDAGEVKFASFSLDHIFFLIIKRIKCLRVHLQLG
jgi:hypothetical protein